MRIRKTCLCLLLIMTSIVSNAAQQSQGSLLGEAKTVYSKPDDTLSVLALEHHLGFDALVAANATLNPYFLGQVTEVKLPTQYLLPNVEHEGIVINLPELRLYFFDGDTVDVWPIGIGRSGWMTPEADTTITIRLENPDWYPPVSIRNEYASAGVLLPASVPAGPDNPLGRHALSLGLAGYLIHGTNQPEGVGKRVSHGCIRMYDKHIAELFERVSVGTRVQIINQPIKWATEDGVLMLEAHQPLNDGTSSARAIFSESVEAASAGLGDSVRVKGFIRDQLAGHRLFDGLPKIIP